MLGLSVIILFKSLLHVFCSLVFSAHNSSGRYTLIFQVYRKRNICTLDINVYRHYHLMFLVMLDSKSFGIEEKKASRKAFLEYA